MEAATASSSSSLSSGLDNSTTDVCGVIEGIVGPQHDVEQLRGMAVFVENDVVQE